MSNIPAIQATSPKLHMPIKDAGVEGSEFEHHARPPAQHEVSILGQKGHLGS